MAARTAIVGVGNSLMMDDGIGVHVARALANAPLPDDAVVIDAGTDPDVAFDLEGVERVIVVDAARCGGTPGTVYRLSPQDGMDSEDGRRACHDVGFLQTLRDIAATGEAPEIVLVGVEPEAIEWGLDLSPIVEASIPRVVEIVRRELGWNERRS